jgi:hypothetical protein
MKRGMRVLDHWAPLQYSVRGTSARQMVAMRGGRGRGRDVAKAKATAKAKPLPKAAAAVAPKKTLAPKGSLGGLGNSLQQAIGRAIAKGFAALIPKLAFLVPRKVVALPAPPVVASLCKREYGYAGRRERYGGIGEASSCVGGSPEDLGRDHRN